MKLELVTKLTLVNAVLPKPVEGVRPEGPTSHHVICPPRGTMLEVVELLVNVGGGGAPSIMIVTPPVLGEGDDEDY